MSLSNETKTIFDAPWELDEEEQVRNASGDLVAEGGVSVDDLRRVTHLPELYDTLLKCICSSCNICIYTHCGSPVDCEQLLSQECTYEDSKICFEKEARELLKKVRDGK